MGCSSAVTVIKSSFLHCWVPSWVQQHNASFTSFTYFIFSPMSPGNSCTEPRNWSETFEAPISTGGPQDFAFYYSLRGDEGLRRT